MMSPLSLLVFLTGLNSQYVSDWPIFRGDAAQDGIRLEKSPDKLEQLWKYSTKDSIEGAPAIVEGVAYVGSYDEHLHAIDIKTGNLKWKVKLGPIKSSPSIKGDRIYVGDVDGKLYCLELKTGNKIWTFETNGEITGGANFYKDLILIGSHDETLYCLEANGKKKWEFKANGPVNGVPSVVGNRTFVAGCDNNLHIIEIETGAEKAAIDLGGPCGATAAISGEELFVGTMNNEVIAVDLKKEKINWRFAAPRRQQAFYSSAAVTDSLVIVGSRDKKLYAIDRRKGEAVWDFLTDNRVDSSPIIVGDKIFIGSLDRTFYVLDLKGTKLQQFDLDGAIIGSPAYSDGKILLGTDKGTVFCFGSKKL
ncbi:PQQ-binding-like beta-propeller repeat protein [Telmatocola sphagniphila]|uniref:PQQ-binding-like beta-propeller repeat protein n=1 Tax=Telmatocola sphagniphila TaxID=1123043 RepID=A0A8E6B4V5_9BACT|nr:PQQ-binding-like beta-propeller repeat protein [Telmatocola sphagniphila]QVL30543.1 PQQ-binding-like beta-propeller repeat protein [Telmatocola sphagniphila]